jgi:hypothetical protein
MYLGMFFYIPFNGGELFIVEVDEFGIQIHASLDTRVIESIFHKQSIRFISQVFPDPGEIILRVGIVDVGEEFCTFSHEVVPASEEVTSRSHRSGIDIGHGEGSPTEE